ncbi:MAG: hypothetical protein ABR507_05910 [Actinomycetota bacterium]|nr:hypothetical protein [Actinomycetota bacterium]
MSKYEDYEASRIRHLEMVQAVISRLSNEGFVVKGWAITLSAAFLGVAVNVGSWVMALVTIGPTVAFWGLDTYFLRSERLFRELYDSVRIGDETVEPFFMSATASTFVGPLSAPSSTSMTSWWQTFRRPTLELLYGALVIAALLVAFLLLISSHPNPH